MAIVAPIVAYASGWDNMPTNIWLDAELDWATPLSPEGLSKLQVEAIYEPPPRADWCGPSGAVAVPSDTECDDYDVALDDWMMDFTGAASVADLPAFTDPPTYCGGC